MEKGVKDLYNSEKLFKNWIKRVEVEGIKDLSSKNSNLIIQMIKDFSIGINTSNKSVKGARSFTRLNHLQQKISFVLRKLEERGIKDINKLKEKDIHKLFNDMRTGVISTRNGTAYKSTGDYVKEFKCFWHWYQKIKKKEGEIIEDITEDLDTRGEKPKFIYFSKEDFEKLLAKASYDLKPILALAFDSGMRPSELLNTKINDFSKGFKELNIREEVSKTFGRKIKLMLCSEQIDNYVQKMKLKGDDFLCKISKDMININLRSLGKQCLTSEQIKFKNLTLYDFRHSSCCHWLPIYKSEMALKYRFGWKKSDMIHYYTEYLGMKDTICQEDMYVDITKTELEKDIKKVKAEMDKMKQDQKLFLKSMQKAMAHSSPKFNKALKENVKIKDNGELSFK